MPGGKRPGAGRKPGADWRGKHPRPDSVRELARSRVKEVLKTEKDPIAVLVEIANNPANDVQVRVQAASAAAPFIFPRLSASVVAAAPAPTGKDDHQHLIERIMGKIARRAPPIDHQPLAESEAA